MLKRFLHLLPPGAGVKEREKLEQLRVLEHGHRIAVVVRHCDMVGVDTPEQYAVFVERMRGK